MRIDDEFLNKMEKISKLEISEDEKKILKKDLNEALEYFDKINTIKFDNLGLLDEISTDIFREDLEAEFEEKEALLKEAHEKYGKYFSVPAVMEGEIKS